MADRVLARLGRDTAVVAGVLAVLALAVWPREMRAALGVVGGGLLVALSGWAIASATGEALAAGREGRRPGARALVKFVTRHAILALAAYVMMARLGLDPVGMLVGVSALGAAAALEAGRAWRGGQAS
ncbi:MAG: ATP synthase subunit I [Acidobacteriota bacterium]